MDNLLRRFSRWIGRPGSVRMHRAGAVWLLAMVVATMISPWLGAVVTFAPFLMLLCPVVWREAL